MSVEDNDWFSGLLEDIDGIDNVLREVDSDPSLNQPRLLFVRFREHRHMLNEFVEVISAQLVNYVIPLRKRRLALIEGSKSSTKGNTAAVTRLNREATKLLLKFNENSKSRYGEVGELISFVVATRFLKAAQLGSKMALKTASEMPVYGVDGLHVRPESDGTITFYTLESKLAPVAATATREFCDSVSAFDADRVAQENELRLINDLSNLDELQGEQRDAAKSYFNLYSGNDASLMRREMHVGSLVYSESAYSKGIPRDASKSIDIHEKHFCSLYSATHAASQKNLKNQAKKVNFDLGGSVVFLIAVPDINDLKRAFAETNNGHIRN